MHVHDTLYTTDGMVVMRKRENSGTSCYTELTSQVSRITEHSEFKHLMSIITSVFPSMNCNCKEA